MRAFSVPKSPLDKGSPIQSQVTAENASDSDNAYNECDASEENDADAEHIALVQDAWNALMAKHSSITNYASSPPRVATLFSQNSALSNSPPVSTQKDFSCVDIEEEDDFRCIAVEINEERFAVDLPSPVKLPDFKPTSPPKGTPPEILLTPIRLEFRLIYFHLVL